MCNMSQMSRDVSIVAFDNNNDNNDPPGPLHRLGDQACHGIEHIFHIFQVECSANEDLTSLGHLDSEEEIVLKVLILVVVHIAGEKELEDKITRNGRYCTKKFRQT